MSELKWGKSIKILPADKGIATVRDVRALEVLSPSSSFGQRSKSYRAWFDCLSSA